MLILRLITTRNRCNHLIFNNHKTRLHEKIGFCAGNLYAI